MSIRALVLLETVMLTDHGKCTPFQGAAWPASSKQVKYICRYPGSHLQGAVAPELAASCRSPSLLRTAAVAVAAGDGTVARAEAFRRPLLLRWWWTPQAAPALYLGLSLRQ